jgi:hypothetical protein
VSFVKIDHVTAIFYVGSQVDCCMYFAYLLMIWVQSDVDLHVMPADSRQYCDSLVNSAYLWASMKFRPLSIFSTRCE